MTTIEVGDDQAVIVIDADGSVESMALPNQDDDDEVRACTMSALMVVLLFTDDDPEIVAMRERLAAKAIAKRE